MSSSDWTLVAKKKKNKETDQSSKPKNTNNSTQNDNNNLSKNNFISEDTTKDTPKKDSALSEYIKKKGLNGYRPIEEHDYTLTEEEKEKLKNHYMPCTCCCAYEIAQVLKRKFTGCGVCFCCAGDDPTMYENDLCIFIDESFSSKYIFWDEDCPRKYYDSK